MALGGFYPKLVTLSDMRMYLQLGRLQVVDRASGRTEESPAILQAASDWPVPDPTGFGCQLSSRTASCRLPALVSD